MNTNSPPPLRNLVADAECVVILPYALTIVDCHFISKAFLTQRDAATFLDGHPEAVDAGDPFAVYEFDRNVDESEAVILARSGRDFAFWDSRERFVLIGGSEEFCSMAAPYPPDVLKHYYVEGMKEQLSDAEAQGLYSQFSKGTPRSAR